MDQHQDIPWSKPYPAFLENKAGAKMRFREVVESRNETGFVRGRETQVRFPLIRWSPWMSREEAEAWKPDPVDDERAARFAKEVVKSYLEAEHDDDDIYILAKAYLTGRGM